LTVKGIIENNCWMLFQKCVVRLNLISTVLLLLSCLGG